MFISVVLALIPHIVYILAKAVGWIFQLPAIAHQISFPKVSYRPFGLVALGLVVLWSALFVWGNRFGRFRYEKTSADIAVSQLPSAFDGYRIVHISDFHLDGWADQPEMMQQIVDTINAADPDLIVFTGDLVSIDKGELTPFIPVLSQLRAKDGVFSIMGNHDYMPYNRSVSDKQRAVNVAELQRMEREDLGWHLLLNENSIIRRGSDSIAIVGCENHSMGVHRVVQRGDLRKALLGTEGMSRIILTHDPTHWRGEIVPLMKKEKGTLTLSGHTHSGQFRVLGFSAASFVYDEYDGRYDDGNHTLYVNIGLGGTMPMRIGATPEITEITLKRK